MTGPIDVASRPEDGVTSVHRPCPSLRNNLAVEPVASKRSRSPSLSISRSVMHPPSAAAISLAPGDVTPDTWNDRPNGDGGIGSRGADVATADGEKVFAGTAVSTRSGSAPVDAMA